MNGEDSREEDSAQPNENGWSRKEYVVIDKEGAEREEMVLPGTGDEVLVKECESALIEDKYEVKQWDCVFVKGNEEAPMIALIHKILKVYEYDEAPDDEAGHYVVVTWLYRWKDIELKRKRPMLKFFGINNNKRESGGVKEVFFSAHKDTIELQTVMHPCKVWFVREGREPPKAVHLMKNDQKVYDRTLNGFLCNRFYDTHEIKLYPLQDVEADTDAVFFQDCLIPEVRKLLLLTRKAIAKKEACRQKTNQKARERAARRESRIQKASEKRLKRNSDKKQLARKWSAEQMGERGGGQAHKRPRPPNAERSAQPGPLFRSSSAPIYSQLPPQSQKTNANSGRGGARGLSRSYSDAAHQPPVQQKKLKRLKRLGDLPRVEEETANGTGGDVNGGPRADFEEDLEPGEIQAVDGGGGVESGKSKAKTPSVGQGKEDEKHSKYITKKDGIYQVLVFKKWKSKVGEVREERVWVGLFDRLADAQAECEIAISMDHVALKAYVKENAPRLRMNPGTGRPDRRGQQTSTGRSDGTRALNMKLDKLAGNKPARTGPSVRRMEADRSRQETGRNSVGSAKADASKSVRSARKALDVKNKTEEKVADVAPSNEEQEAGASGRATEELPLAPTNKSDGGANMDTDRAPENCTTQNGENSDHIMTASPFLQPRINTTTAPVADSGMDQVNDKPALNAPHSGMNGKTGSGEHKTEVATHSRDKQESERTRKLLNDMDADVELLMERWSVPWLDELDEMIMGAFKTKCGGVNGKKDGELDRSSSGTEGSWKFGSHKKVKWKCAIHPCLNGRRLELLADNAVHKIVTMARKSASEEMVYEGQQDQDGQPLYFSMTMEGGMHLRNPVRITTDSGELVGIESSDGSERVTLVPKYFFDMVDIPMEHTVGQRGVGNSVRDEKTEARSIERKGGEHGGEGGGVLDPGPSSNPGIVNAASQEEGNEVASSSDDEDDDCSSDSSSSISIG